MDNPVEKVLEMVRSGKIEASDGDKLIKALREHFDDVPWDDDFSEVDDDEVSGAMGEELSDEDGDEKATLGDFKPVPESGEISLEGMESVRIEMGHNTDLVFRESEGPSPRILADEKTTGALKIWRENGLAHISVSRGKNRDFHRVELELQSPFPLPVQINSVSGDLRMENILGNINAGTVSGDIALEDFKGEKAVLGSTGSNIEVLRAGGELELKSVSGDLKVEEMEGNVHASTISGDLECYDISGEVHFSSRSGDVEGSDVEGLMECKTVSGDIEIFSIGGKVRIKTVSGDVEVERSMGSFNIQSTSGDLDMKRVTVEDMDIRTSSGDVNLEIECLEEGAPVKVKTRSSYICLRLPPEADGKVTARTRSGYIDNNIKFHQLDTMEEKFLEGTLSDSQEIELPGINLKTGGGNIKLSNRKGSGKKESEKSSRRKYYDGPDKYYEGPDKWR